VLHSFWGVLFGEALSESLVPAGGGVKKNNLRIRQPRQLKNRLRSGMRFPRRSGQPTDTHRNDLMRYNPHGGGSARHHEWKVVDMQIDSEAIDQAKTVTPCERRKLNG